MLILHDYLPSQNAYKVRILLHHLDIPYQTKIVSLFEGAGRTPEYLAKNPMGGVPVLELEDGRTLPESNAILCYLAEGTPYLPADAWQRAQTLRWLFFEEDLIQNGLASLRYWTMTGKKRSPEMVESKRRVSLRTLQVLDGWLAQREFLVDYGYTVADMSVYAYTAFATDANLPISEYPNVVRWTHSVRSQPRFLDEVHPYSIDPHSSDELP